MRKRYQNGFFWFGIAVLAIMASQLNFAQTVDCLRNTGLWFVAVVSLWVFLYVINTFSWYIIIRAGGKSPIRFSWLYKITVSGFALNYATPGGLMGGEPYRIMELSQYIGTERASSSVILYAMTHIFSHFWFWLLSVILFLFTERLTLLTSFFLLAMTVFCISGIWFFISGYRKGLAIKAVNLLRHIPYVKRWATGFIEKNSQRLHTIDTQIASLHKQNRKNFFTAVLLELLCRIFSAIEIYFVLVSLSANVSYMTCIFILSFTTLFANMLFFIPLQLGGREGGFLISATSLGLTASTGIIVALIVRLRELVWTAIGLLLIKLEKNRK